MSFQNSICSRGQLRLDSWKSIADYVGRSCRTVQRWHTRYSLPVRHIDGRSSSVFAFTDELDGWFQDRERFRKKLADSGFLKVRSV